MNNTTRKELRALIEKLEEVFSDLETMSSDEQEKFDNLTEGLQATEKGQEMEQAASTLSDQAYSLRDIIDELSGMA